jgi:hypothetical protein
LRASPPTVAGLQRRRPPPLECDDEDPCELDGEDEDELLLRDGDDELLDGEYDRDDDDDDGAEYEGRDGEYVDELLDGAYDRDGAERDGEYVDEPLDGAYDRDGGVQLRDGCGDGRSFDGRVVGVDG